MDEFEKIISDLYEKYPQSELTDSIKLAFQNEFGCRHHVSDITEKNEGVSEKCALIRKRCSAYLPILSLLSQKKNEKIIMAIDGRCGSGKTTLAQKLSNLILAPVIHMDDFFLPPNLRTDARLSEAGGNIHYERFLDEVVAGLKTGNSFCYKPFICSTMDYGNPITINIGPIIIVEGAYSTHPLFKDIYNVKVFCDISESEQKQRIICRDGAERYQDFEQKWIPMEEKYFKEFNIREKCDLIIK